MIATVRLLARSPRVNWIRFGASTGGGGTPTATDVVVYASDLASSAPHAAWTVSGDAASPFGLALGTPDNGTANLDAPLASPVDYVDVRFSALANTPYTLWLHMMARGDTTSNDSVWVQFSDALANGAPVYPIGSTSGLLVNLATDGTGASLNRWGWQNAAYWLSQATMVTFASSGTHTVRIQVREDGAAINQIVLSPTNYLTSPPAGPTDDFTTVPKPASDGQPYAGTPPNGGRLEAEDFDLGGEGIGYHDMTAGNAGASIAPVRTSISLAQAVRPTATW